MTSRAPPGPQLAVGRLRVDAARAILKLRAYQLVDRIAWVLEAIRAAVAAGATAIELRGDANDVWLRWTGVPLAAGELPALFDELVSPEPGSSRHHVRLLAGAINSALGLDPAYVDVVAISADGVARVRYTPEVLETPAGDLEHAPLRDLRVEMTADAADEAPGMRIHLRRRVGLDVLSYFLGSGEPPELALARTQCRDIGVPLRIGDRALDRAASTHDLLRLSLGDGLDGFIAIVDPAGPRPLRSQLVIEVAERGVVLAAYTANVAACPEARGPLPIRVFLDGPRMPTNASRSQVRRDAHPIAAAEARLDVLVPALIDALAQQLAAEVPDERARTAALVLLGSQVAGADWVGDLRRLDGPLGALAARPLVRDAIGVARPVTGPWQGLVYQGRSPLAPELAPWLSDVLWIPPDDPAAHLVGRRVDTDAMDGHVRWARRERRARDRFYQHAPRSAHVLARQRPRVRAPLGVELAASCVPQSVFTGLEGEVCIHADGTDGELTLLLDGRALETVHLDSAIRFEAVIDSPRLSPTDHYRGAARDLEYGHVERAVQLGIVRALEALALVIAGQPPPRAVDAGPERPDAANNTDQRLVGAGLGLARRLGLRPSPPLLAAPAWATTDGRAVSVETMAGRAVLGTVTSRTATLSLAGRMILRLDDAERALLAPLLSGVRLISYDAAAREGALDARALAARLHASELDDPHVLALRDAGEGMVAAIYPSATPRLLVFHRGLLLGERPLTYRYAPCRIAIDCDAVVPDEHWRALVDDAGLGQRDYTSWERRLARATARALIGERPDDVVGLAAIDLESVLGRSLCAAVVAAADPTELLGEDLTTALRLHPLLTVLGEARPYCVDEIAVLFPVTILFVETPPPPVPGMPLLIATPLLARTIAALTGRRVRDAAGDLEQRWLAIAREQRLAVHRAQEPRELALDDPGPQVELRCTIARGVVGAVGDAFELTVLVEGRHFQTIRRPGELPVSVVVELDAAERAGPGFDVLTDDVIDQLVAAARVAIPDLLAAVVAASPRALVEPGPARSVLARWLAEHGRGHAIRARLRRGLKFPTLTGAYMPMPEVERANLLACSSWHGTWLPPADGEPRHELDRPILQLPALATELHAIVSGLSDGRIDDVTEATRKLQATRQMARGLLPPPTVPGAVPELTRQLVDLGPVGKSLGPGEISLGAGPTTVHLHVYGVLREQITLEILPAVHVAIEAPDLVGQSVLAPSHESAVDQLRGLRDSGHVERALGSKVRELAVVLAREVARAVPHAALPAEVRRNLRRALFAGKLQLADLAAAPVFETASGSWVDAHAFAGQRARFGDLWALPATSPDARPLDEHRLVFVLDPADLARAWPADHPVSGRVIDATAELAADALARTHQARPPATSLAIDDGGVIARISLDGDGVTAPRGTVAVLSDARRRGVHAHRAMHPFDVLDDPCAWPTLAVIDDARLTPDRTWQWPLANEVWTEVVGAIRTASEQALRVSAPPHALAHAELSPWIDEAMPTLRQHPGLAVGGTLWLAGPPLPARATPIRVIRSHGERDFVPLRGLNLAGTIYLQGLADRSEEAFLEELCKRVHARLVRELCARDDRDADLVTAHAAWALALERIAVSDVGDLAFTCFRPVPIDAGALRAVLRDLRPVPCVSPDSASAGRTLALVDDGSHTSRVIRDWLGLRKHASAARADLPPPPERDHPLQPLVTRLHARLGELGIRPPAWRIVDERTGPLARYHGSQLELAGDSTELIDIAHAAAQHHPAATAAIDLLAAHLVTVLNVALTEITDAAEAHAITKLLDTRPARPG